MSAYRVEPAVLDVLRHHYRVFHGADVCVGVARTRAAAERIARALTVLDAMDEHDAGAAAALRAQGWQPIATAPRDWTSVLVYDHASAVVGLPEAQP